MEESKTLIEQLRDMVELSIASNQYPTVHADAILGHICVNKREERELFTIIADRIENEYMPLPRFEDGEPVQFGDEVDSCESQFKVHSVTFCSNGRVFLGDLIDFDELEATGEALKRPHPEVLDADGVQINVGDVVYFIDSAEAFDVLGIESDGDESVHIGRKDGTSTDAWVSPGDLTHKQPDTLERIDEDAMKMFNDYWGCGDAECRCCPAIVDGKKPCDRYVTDGSCTAAQKLDLLRRQREVLERGQE